MPLAGMSLGPIFENAGWLEVVGFFAGVACLFGALGAVFYRASDIGRAGRSAAFAGMAAVLLGFTWAVRYTADACGYAPVGWLARFGPWWMWGVGLAGFGLALTSLQRRRG